MFIIGHVRHHGQTRVDLLDRVCGGVVDGAGAIERHVHDDRRNPHRHLGKVGEIELQLGHEHVHALGMGAWPDVEDFYRPYVVEVGDASNDLRVDSLDVSAGRLGGHVLFGRWGNDDS